MIECLTETTTCVVAKPLVIIKIKFYKLKCKTYMTSLSAIAEARLRIMNSAHKFEPTLIKSL